MGRSPGYGVGCFGFVRGASWVVPVVLAGAGVLVLAGVVLAAVLVRRMRRARDAGRAVPVGTVGGAGVPPVPYGVTPSYGGPAARSAPVAGSYPNAGAPADTRTSNAGWERAGRSVRSSTAIAA